MGSFRLDQLLEWCSGANLLRALLWGGTGLVVVSLAVMMFTRWGQLHPLRKCLILSLVAHLLLIEFSTTILISPSLPAPRERVFQVSLGDKSTESASPPGKPDGSARVRTSGQHPWDSFAEDAVGVSRTVDLARADIIEVPSPVRRTGDAAGLPGTPVLGYIPLTESRFSAPKSLPAASPDRPKSPAVAAQPIVAPAAQARPGARAAVSDPGLDRPAGNDTAVPSPVRAAAESVPSALLERPLAPPRLSINSDRAPAETMPTGSLKTDSPASPAHPAVPAATLAAGQPESDPTSPTDRGATPGPQAASGPGTGPNLDAATAHLRPPSATGLSGEGPAAAGSGNSSGPGNLVGAASSGVGPPNLPRPARDPGGYEVPEMYRLRIAPNRAQIAERLGSTPQREDAVKAALQWLADNQEPDGRWSPTRHAGGQEAMESGRDRQGAGARADTGITGLAILAFTASGNTHLQGPHKETVRRGLEFLISMQAADGSLGGQGSKYEFMYCHGIATLALSEALGMTGDARLRPAVVKATSYTVAAQDPNGGGWRYGPQESGDTSQLGWQLMALKSAELAGIPIPQTTWEGALRFLDGVSSGSHGGLASYRPGEKQSRTMTAEALACRQFLGLHPDHPTAREAGDYLLAELPGEGQANLYYWYYATMATYQLQGTHWRVWNDAIQKILLATQRTSGPASGSWDPNTRWDGYGGRVYSTALAALCLEAYYRFLPLHVGRVSESRPAR